MTTMPVLSVTYPGGGGGGGLRTKNNMLRIPDKSLGDISGFSVSFLEI